MHIKELVEKGEKRRKVKGCDFQLDQVAVINEVENRKRQQFGLRSFDGLNWPRPGILVELNLGHSHIFSTCRTL